MVACRNELRRGATLVGGALPQKSEVILGSGQYRER